VEAQVQTVAAFVQVSDDSWPPPALWTTVHCTDERVVLRLEHDGCIEDVVLVRDGRFELPVLEARIGRHWEFTLAGPSGGRLMLQLELSRTQTAPPPEEGDEAVAAAVAESG